MDPLPKTTLSVAQRPLFVGVDIGGTGIKIGLLDNLGRTLAATQISTQAANGAQDAVDRIEAAIREMLTNLGLTRTDVAAVGLGCPGTMDIPRGYLVEPPNLPAWWDFPIRDALATATGLPVAFANDGAAAAYGEYWIGSGQQFNSIVMLTLGTGVGGGIILGDLAVDGENSHGSECGHIIVETGDDARRCSCGQLGHLEAYASATAVIKRTEEALQSGAQSSLRTIWERGDELNGLRVAEAGDRDDALALNIIMGTADYLSTGVVTLVHTIDPGAVILGGAMNFGGSESQLGRAFLARVVKGFRDRAFPVLARNTVIDFASLGGNAGYIGAAGLARRQFSATSS